MILDLPFQKEGAAWLAARNAAGLADEQGLGKSFQAILAAHAAGATNIVVTCPAKLRANWRREFEEKATPNRHRRLRVMGYEEATDVFRHVSPTSTARRPDVHMLDEAQYLKNWRSQRTQAIYPKHKVAGATWIMSGTPMPNDPSELWTHFYYLRPDLITVDGAPMTPIQFMQEFCKLGIPKMDGSPRVVGVQNVERLRALNRQLWLRRTVKEVLPQLPEMRYGEILLDAPCPPGMRALEQDEKRVAQLMVDPHMLPIGDEWLATMRRMIAAAKAGPLAGFIAEELTNNPDEKIVIFAWHTEAIDIMAGALTDFAPVIVDGRTPPAKVQPRVDLFQNNPEHRVFIGQIISAGTGLTLTAASNVVFLEYSWTPTDNEQAERRILRIGQTAQSCLCRYATLLGSIDEPVMRVLTRKNGMINKVMERQ